MLLLIIIFPSIFQFFVLGKKQLLITGLPVYYDGCYTEDDIAKLLISFGFQNQDDNINVVPQMRMVGTRF